MRPSFGRSSPVTLGCIALLAAGPPGCASVSTTPASPDDPPNGIRIHPTRVYLFVDREQSRSQLVYAPDPESAYDVKPVSFLAEHDFKMDIEAGQVKSLTSNANPAAILALFKEATDIAAGAGLGRGTTDTTLEGTFGLEEGIYVLRNGRFEKVSPPARPIRKSKQVSVGTSGVGADRRTPARSEARKTRGGGSSTPGEIIAPAGFRNRNKQGERMP